MILSPLIVQISQFCFIAGNGIAYGNGCFSPYMLFFLIGMRHWKILTCLRMDGIQISMSTLQRRLKLFGLHRRKAQSDLLEIALFLQEQLNQYGMLHGYRFMHLKCIQAGLVVTQSTVRCLLKILDPQGVQLRLRWRLRRRLYRNPGPNFLWQVDSYDKLQPYGICINGAVVGFSRVTIWLHAYSTNNNPRVMLATSLMRSTEGAALLLVSERIWALRIVYWGKCNSFQEVPTMMRFLKDATLPVQVTIIKELNNRGDF